jgi:hypothetical protein
MSSTGLSQRLAKFKQNFSQILGPKRQGYNEVGLDQPLVTSHAQSDDEYFQKHGVPRPGSQQPSGYNQYQVPEGAFGSAGAGAGLPYPSGAANAMPDEVGDIRSEVCIDQTPSGRISPLGLSLCTGAVRSNGVYALISTSTMVQTSV